MAKNLIRAESARWFAKYMVLRGIPIARLLEGTRLDEVWLEEKETGVSPADYLQIVRNALDESGDPALGLSLGKGQNLVDFGVWGYAIISSATIGEADRIALKYWELSGSLVKLSFKRDYDISTWEIYPAFPYGETRLLIWAIEEHLSTQVAAARFLASKEIPVHEIHVTYSRPEHADIYHEMFDCPVIFNSDKNRLQVESRFMDLPTVMAHPQFAELCRRQCDEMLLKLRESDELVDSIRRQIISAPGDFPKFDDMAERLVLSPRTLSRRLRERDTSYQRILDEVRMELAREYLTTTNLSIDQISDLIGFSETSTFRRAFKKWTGQSAAGFRKKRMISA